MTVNVFNGDGGHVHEDADRERESAQRHEVDRLTGQPQREHRCQQRERNVVAGRIGPGGRNGDRNLQLLRTLHQSGIEAAQTLREEVAGLVVQVGLVEFVRLVVVRQALRRRPAGRIVIQVRLAINLDL